MNLDTIAHWIQQQDEELEYDPDGLLALIVPQWMIFAPREIVTGTFTWNPHTWRSGSVEPQPPIPALIRPISTDLT